MPMINGLFTSNKQDWTTPPDLYKKLDDEFNFDFDPCPLDPQFDGLSIEWGQCNFVNPPYDELSKWIKKGYNESLKGNIVVFLIPARTDTQAFHEYLYPYAEIRFIKGRLKFSDSKNPAPFPSMICILYGSLYISKDDHCDNSCMNIATACYQCEVDNDCNCELFTMIGSKEM